MFRKRHPPVGARPGTLMFDEHAPAPTLTLIEYGADDLREEEVAVADLPRYRRGPNVSWIDVRGLGDPSIIQAVAETFGIHPLALEDVVNTPQRPKVEVFADHALVIMRTARQADGVTELVHQQLSMFVGSNYVLTFQEGDRDEFPAIRERLHRGNVRIRTGGPGYLAYALIDAVVDAYYPIVEAMGDLLEDLEGEVVDNPTPSLLHRLHQVKRELLALRRAIWPHREVLNTLMRGETPFMPKEVRVYLHDVHDHCVQQIDVLETYREMAGGLLDIYLSSVGNRTNDVMKVLTIMASIFIPLTFIAGVYGMNFEFMPELHHRGAYPAVLSLMGLVALGMVAGFYRRGWLWRARQAREE